MDALAHIVKIAALTLLGIESVSVGLRMRLYNDKREPLFFLAALILLMAKTIIPYVPYVHELLTLLLIFTVKSYLSLIMRSRLDTLYNFIFAAVVLIMLALIPLHLNQTVSFMFFSVFASFILTVPVAILAVRLQQRMGRGSIAVIAAVALFLFLTRRAEEVAGLWLAVPEIAGDILLLCLSLAIGYLIFEEEYFIVGSMRSIASGLAEEQRLALEMSSRLSTTEETLIAQDRLVSSGVLAAGVSHEFKNIISLISNCAQYGLYQSTVEKKDDGFRMIQDHVDHSMGSVIRVLDRIRKRETQKPEEVDAGEFISRLVKIIRANYRPSGVAVTLTVQSTFRTLVKPDDLEQIILNLTHNAAAALTGRREPGDRRLGITVRNDGLVGVIEIMDNAGGIGGENALRLFEQHGRPRQSNGMGLYLTRLLVEQNDLTLHYRLLADGSSFCLGCRLLSAGDAD